MAVKYVKFVRGSSLAFENIVNKDSDTLYFITDSDSGKGSLYLGSKLISGNISDLADLQDILIDDYTYYVGWLPTQSSLDICDRII